MEKVRVKEIPSEEKIHPLVIAYDIVCDHWPCGICGKEAISRVPLSVMTQDTHQFVCDECTKKYAPEIYQLIDYALKENITSHG